MTRAVLTRVYDALHDRFGPQHWWPGDTQFEVIVGAILTQNTAWTNVEKAIINLKKAGALASPSAMKKLSVSRLAALIRPAGYYNIKAKRLKNFLDFLDRRYGMSLKRLSRVDTDTLRRELLEVNGIGPETRDSILLYAFDRPVFVIDAYTKRIFSRHGAFDEGSSYSDIQAYFIENLRLNKKLFNEYHALIVKLGKEFCRKSPKCAACPLHGFKFACK
jgi:endonuclease-3 related protein